MAAHVQQRISAYYIQDDWKARKNFTVNLGMRYEYYTPPYGVGQFVNVNFNMLTGQLNAAPGAPLVVGNGQGVQVVPASNRYAVQPDKADWGPRVGLIYQLNNKLVLRGGFGYYYNGEDFYGSNGTNLVFNPPDVYELALVQVGSRTRIGCSGALEYQRPTSLQSRGYQHTLLYHIQCQRVLSEFSSGQDRGMERGIAIPYEPILHPYGGIRGQLIARHGTGLER